MEPEKEDVQVEESSEFKAEKRQSRSKNKDGEGSSLPKIVLGVSLIASISLGAFFLMGNQSAPTPKVVNDVTTERAVADFSYQQFPPGGPRKVESEADLPPSLAKINPTLLADLVSEQSELRRIKVYDFMENDGDVVEVTVNQKRVGFYELTNTEKEILVPFYKNKVTLIKVKAVDDGGGGVTFGMRGDRREFKTKVMQLGETFSWSFSR